MENSKPQLKLMTKKEFEAVRGKFVAIDESANSIINSSKNDLDVLALTIQEGSGFKVLVAKIINENTEEEFIQLLKSGV